MSEIDVIKNTGGQPVTISSLKKDLTELGVKKGMTLMVHSALSKIGWVAGGPVAVILALEQVLGDEGTLVMPTHSGGLTDPAGWQNPPVPKSWVQTIRDETPAYDPDLSPTRSMGMIPETFRKQPGTIRSDHPHQSFAARGPLAAQITEGQPLDYSMGEGSPLAKVYDAEGWVLLLGVTHSNNTSLHLAEYRASYPNKKVEKNGAPMMVKGKRQWVEMEEINLDESDFEQIGAAFAKETGKMLRGKAGIGDALLMPQRELVDFAAAWMERERR